MLRFDSLPPTQLRARPDLSSNAPAQAPPPPRRGRRRRRHGPCSRCGWVDGWMGRMNGGSKMHSHCWSTTATWPVSDHAIPYPKPAYPCAIPSHPIQASPLLPGGGSDRSSEQSCAGQASIDRGPTVPSPPHKNTLFENKTTRASVPGLSQSQQPPPPPLFLQVFVRCKLRALAALS